MSSVSSRDSNCSRSEISERKRFAAMVPAARQPSLAFALGAGMAAVSLKPKPDFRNHAMIASRARSFGPNQRRPPERAGFTNPDFS